MIKTFTIRGGDRSHTIFAFAYLRLVFLFLPIIMFTIFVGTERLSDCIFIALLYH